MARNHDRWLDWKIRHGLATRGHVGNSPLHPKGLFAGLIYKLFYRKHAVASDVPQTFSKSVGGAIGPRGSTNGD